MRALALGVALVLGCGSMAWGAFGGFGAAALQPLANDPKDLQIADLNGDGHNDIVAVSGAGVSVFANSGGGSFTRIDYTIGAQRPRDKIIVRDFNSDGHLDVAGTDRNSGQTCVMLNNGSGTLLAPSCVVTGPPGGGPTAVDAGDIDGDNDLDLVIAIQNSAQLILLINDGLGTFGSPTAIATPNNPRGVIFARMDGNVSLDIAYVQRSTGRLHILLNDGLGVFTPGGDWGVGVTGLEDIAPGDIDADGDIDLIIASRDSGSRMDVFRNNGSGVFSAFGSYALSDWSGDVDLTDLDGDGYLDAVVALINTGQRARVLLNNGTGLFGSPIDYGTASFVNTVAVGDLDGNSTPDLVTATRSNPAIEIRFNQTDVVAPGPFLLQSPPDSTENLPLPEQLRWPGTQAKVKWGIASGFINTYTVQIATDPAFSNIVFQQPGLSGLEFPLPNGSLLEGTRHYWRVVASNQAGATNSNTFTFTTPCGSDANADGQVNAADLSVLLSQFGGACPK